MRKYSHEIQPEDVGKDVLQLDNHPVRVCDFIGQILPRDVGKRIYRVGDIYQVENDKQKWARLGEAIEMLAHLKSIISSHARRSASSCFASS